MIVAIVAASTAGDVLTARAMKDVGDLDDIRARSGLLGAVRAVVTSKTFLLGVFFMAVGFFSLLTALSWADLSYVLPATALGYVLVTFFGKYFMHENVTPLRWLGVALISCGVGWVTRGPALTEQQPREPAVRRHEEQHEIA